MADLRGGRWGRSPPPKGDKLQKIIRAKRGNYFSLFSTLRFWGQSSGDSPPQIPKVSKMIRAELGHINCYPSTTPPVDFSILAEIWLVEGYRSTPPTTPLSHKIASFEPISKLPPLFEKRKLGSGGRLHQLPPLANSRNHHESYPWGLGNEVGFLRPRPSGRKVASAPTTPPRMSRVNLMWLGPPPIRNRDTGNEKWRQFWCYSNLNHDYYASLRIRWSITVVILSRAQWFRRYKMQTIM